MFCSFPRELNARVSDPRSLMIMMMMFPCRIMTKESRVHGVLEGILEHVLMNLHSIQKNLQFWQSRLEVLLFILVLRD